MTTDAPLNLPPGFELFVEADGTKTVRKREDSVLSQTITFRTTTADKNRLLPLVETFPERTWSAAFKWLVGHPGVQEIIKAKVDGALTSAP